MRLSVALVVLAVAPAALAQNVRADQRTNITVRVSGTLGVQMPAVHAQCADCGLTVPLISKWNLPPGAALGVTLLTQLSEPTAKLATPTVAYRASVRGRGSSSAVVQLIPDRDAEGMTLTIQVQNY